MTFLQEVIEDVGDTDFHSKSHSLQKSFKPAGSYMEGTRLCTKITNNTAADTESYERCVVKQLGSLRSGCQYFEEYECMTVWFIQGPQNRITPYRNPDGGF